MAATAVSFGGTTSGERFSPTLHRTNDLPTTDRAFERTDRPATPWPTLHASPWFRSRRHPHETARAAPRPKSVAARPELQGPCSAAREPSGVQLPAASTAGRPVGRGAICEPDPTVPFGYWLREGQWKLRAIYESLRSLLNLLPDDRPTTNLLHVTPSIFRTPSTIRVS